MNSASLKKKLTRISNESEEGIRKYIANDALNYDDNPKQFFTDIQDTNASTGIANYFIFHSDIENFYNTYKLEIHSTLKKYQATIGKPIVLKGYEYMSASYFALELIAEQMGKELQILN
ncbi:MAG: hypothetical protein MRY83_11940 [Flavobacteriales bacterium]|nr:hypothetical protein [Flavobacteriales bacterium]